MTLTARSPSSRYSPLDPLPLVAQGPVCWVRPDKARWLVGGSTRRVARSRSDGIPRVETGRERVPADARILMDRVSTGVLVVTEEVPSKTWENPLGIRTATRMGGEGIPGGPH